MKKIIFPVCLCLLFLTACKKEVEINGFSMDSFYSISVENLDNEKKEKIKSVMDNADSIFDAYESSCLNTLNKEKYIDKTEKSSDLFEIIEKSLPYCNDYFDIAIRAYTKLWNFTDENPIPPSDFTLTDAKNSVGKDNIIFSGNEITLKNNSEIELGAVAKGYICDKVYEIAGDCEGLFDIGGTVKSSCNRPVTVGIRKPDGGVFCSFEIKKGEGVSTSGIYERNFTYDGKTYHHIIDPKTGKSVENNLLSVTVVSDTALKSDILSTTYFVSGIENAEIDKDTTVIFITKDNEIIVKGKEREIKYSK